MNLEPIIPIAGITLFILVIYQLFYHSKEGFNNITPNNVYIGSTDANGNLNTVFQDSTGATIPVNNITPFPTLHSKPPQLDMPDSDTYPPTCTTKFGSTLCNSSNPKASNLLKYNPDNFEMTYHSIDPAQYFGLKDLIKKDGTLNMEKLHDLYAPPVDPNAKVFEPTYYDSVLFSQKRGIEFN